MSNQNNIVKISSSINNWTEQSNNSSPEGSKFIVTDKGLKGKGLKIFSKFLNKEYPEDPLATRTASLMELEIDNIDVKSLLEGITKFDSEQPISWNFDLRGNKITKLSEKNLKTFSGNKLHYLKINIASNPISDAPNKKILNNLYSTIKDTCNIEVIMLNGNPDQKTLLNPIGLVESIESVSQRNNRFFFLRKAASKSDEGSPLRNSEWTDIISNYGDYSRLKERHPSIAYEEMTKAESKKIDEMIRKMRLQKSILEIESLAINKNGPNASFDVYTKAREELLNSINFLVDSLGSFDSQQQRKNLSMEAHNEEIGAISDKGSKNASSIGLTPVGEKSEEARLSSIPFFQESDMTTLFKEKTEEDDTADTNSLGTSIEKLQKLTENDINYFNTEASRQKQTENQGGLTEWMNVDLKDPGSPTDSLIPSFEKLEKPTKSDENPIKRMESKWDNFVETLYSIKRDQREQSKLEFDDFVILKFDKQKPQHET